MHFNKMNAVLPQKYGELNISGMTADGSVYKIERIIKCEKIVCRKFLKIFRLHYTVVAAQQKARRKFLIYILFGLGTLLLLFI